MEAYIWDLDGTLLDSYGVIVEAARRTAADNGLNDPEDDVLRMVKQGSVTAYLQDVSERCGKSRDELFIRYRQYTHELGDRITLIDGAKETLERLQENGAAHFVYTHRGESSGPVLERLGILDYFREVVTSVYGFVHKPSGEGVEYLVEKYRLNPKQTWYAGTGRWMFSAQKMPESKLFCILLRAPAYRQRDRRTGLYRT